MLSSHYRPINEWFIPQYHYVAYGDGLGPSRLVHDAEIATKRGVLHEVHLTSPIIASLPYRHSRPLNLLPMDGRCNTLRRRYQRTVRSRQRRRLMPYYGHDATMIVLHEGAPNFRLPHVSYYFFSNLMYIVILLLAMVDCCIFNAINCHQVDCCVIPRTCTNIHYERWVL